MKKILFTILLLNFTLLNLYAQAPPKLWESFFNGALNGKDESNNVLTDLSGNVFITGTSFQTFNGGSFTTVKYDENGSQLWADHFSNTEATYKNYGKRLVMDKWQNVYAVGTTALNEGDLAICKYNSNGRVWAKDYEPYWFQTYDDYGIDMDVDSSGNFYAIARVTSPSGNLYDMYIMKCDSSGTMIWEDNYTGASAADYPVALAVTPGGTAYPLLQSYNFFGTSTQDITTIQYLSSGIQNWFSRYNGAGNAEDYPTFMKIDAAENQYLCGTTDAGATNDMVAIKQNIYGTRLWVTTYNGTANGNDTAISETWLPNGFVVITGKSKELLNGSTVDAIVTMVVDSGPVVWTNKYYGTDSLGASPLQMITDAQGNIYICGFENLVGGTKNGCILKYDSNGNLLWNISYDAGVNLNDKFNSIALDFNNDVLVTGQTFTSATNSNYVTVKYANTPTAINENYFTDEFIIYPNPAKNLVTIALNLMERKNTSVSVIDVAGREIKNFSLNLLSGNSRMQLDLSGMNPGIYFVRLNSNKNTLVKKLVIEN